MLAFESTCEDGRCDGKLWIGLTPLGFVYDPTDEDFAFSLSEVRAEDTVCPIGTVTGVVTPTAWDGQGPVEFTWTRRAELLCDTGIVVTEWEGIGRRR